ncbi:MAG: SDR family oxidoreductase [Candidatus Moraniibacteriota bacterium]|nr:MAG: SDR family oxidoreductase [Candidatus Moranbacteria bacterium]
MITFLKQFISRQFLYPKVRIPSGRNLCDQVVIVTGAGRGIGKAIAEMIYAEGGSVVAVSRRLRSLEEAFPHVESKRFVFAEGDVSDEQTVRSIVLSARKKFGKVDVLVNNAGINMVEKPLEEISAEDFDRMVATNIRGAFLFSKGVIPLMKNAASGFIITIGSKISHNTNVGPSKTVYAMTKYALEGFSFALNRELKSYGIRVSCLMPGTVNTFASLNSKQFLSPYQVAEIVCMMIRYEDIDFESVVLKSKKQNI